MENNNRRKLGTYQICLIALAIVMNVIGGQIALALRLPIYLDSIGTIEKRYIGTTDEPLCDTGTAQIQEYMSAGCYPKVQALYVSPLKRCSQTAAFIYPDMKQIIVQDFRECDFGKFEGKNYKELTGDEYYQKWI